MPIPGGFATAPTVTVAALASPAPGVQVTVSLPDPSAVAVTVWRTSPSRPEAQIVRGAVQTTIAGVFTVADFEAPLGEVLSYTAATFDASLVQSDESIPATITLASDVAWLTDPLDPTTAVACRLREAPSRLLPIDRVVGRPVGGTRGVQISSQRQEGSLDPLAFTAPDATTRIALVGVLKAAPVVLLRCPDPAWDVPAEFLGIGNVSVRRISPKVQHPARYLECENDIVERPDPTIAGAVHTWDELTGSGKTWAQVAAGRTWVTLAQQGPP